MLERIISEGIETIQESQPGVYTVITKKSWEKLKEKAKDSYYFGWPKWIKEINRKHVDEIRKYNPNINKMIKE